MKERIQGGFTLIELLIVMFIATVILGVGIPNFREFIDNNRMAAAVNDLVSDFHLARSEAVKRRANVTLCASANWNAPAPACGGTIADGWIVFVDCSAAAPCGAPNLNVDAFDAVLKAHPPMDDTITPATDAGALVYMTYNATGFPQAVPAIGAPAANFVLCDDRGNKDTGGGIAAGRWVQIGPTGRPQIYREVDDVQSAQNPVGGC